MLENVGLMSRYVVDEACAALEVLLVSGTGNRGETATDKPALHPPPPPPPPPWKARQQNTVLGLVPFYSGTTGSQEATGNAHAQAPRTTKVLWLKATVHTMLPWMAHVVVGVIDGHQVVPRHEPLLVQPLVLARDLPRWVQSSGRPPVSSLGTWVAGARCGRRE